jgi:hypothetical protein
MTNVKDGLPLLQLINERLEEMGKNDLRGLFSGIIILAFLLTILILLNAADLYCAISEAYKCG